MLLNTAVAAQGPQLIPTAFISDLSERQAAFAQFIAEHGRSYTSKDHADDRFDVFSQNYERIKAHNSNPNSGYQMGINQFADMTREELHEHLMSGQNKLKVPKHTRLRQS